MQLFFGKFLRILILFAICVGFSRCQQIDGSYRGGLDRDNPYDSTERNTDSMLCMDIRAQPSIDINKITGMWYGSEIIIHTQDVPGTYRYDSCVVIYLSDITAQMQNHYYHDNNYRRIGITQQQYDESNQQRQQQQQHQQQSHQQRQQYHRNYDNEEPPQQSQYLRLVWTERDDTLEYTFNYTANSPGLWTNVGEQRGSLVAANQYTQFSGTVQVVKAVGDHLVLTFCGNSLKTTIYTVVLARKRDGLNSEDLNGIRKLLSRRGLYTDTIRKVCVSTAAALKATITIVLLLGIASIFGTH